MSLRELLPPLPLCPRLPCGHPCCLLARSDDGCNFGCDDGCDSSCNTCPSCNSVFGTGHVGQIVRCNSGGTPDDNRWNWCTKCVQPCGTNQYLSKKCSFRAWREYNPHLLNQKWTSDSGACSTCSNIECGNGKHRQGACNSRAAGCNSVATSALGRAPSCLALEAQLAPRSA